MWQNGWFRNIICTVFLRRERIPNTITWPFQVYLKKVRYPRTLNTHPKSIMENFSGCAGLKVTINFPSYFSEESDGYDRINQNQGATTSHVYIFRLYELLRNSAALYYSTASGYNLPVKFRRRVYSYILIWKYENVSIWIVQPARCYVIIIKIF